MVTNQVDPIQQKFNNPMIKQAMEELVNIESKRPFKMNKLQENIL